MYIDYSAVIKKMMGKDKYKQEYESTATTIVVTI
jgi:hypothetical protein